MPRCSICNAEGVNKSSCPLNPNAKHVKSGCHNVNANLQRLEEEADHTTYVAATNDIINDLQAKLDKLIIQNEELTDKNIDFEHTNVKLWQKYMKEADEADLYYARWHEAKQKHQRANPPLKVDNRVTALLKESKSEESYEVCSICLENMSKTDYCVTVCGHEFHESCLDLAIENSTTDSCPLCRT